jgi:steroid 5-alpha reductase family enzyme
MSTAGVLAITGAALAVLMLGTWIVSLPIRNVSIIDIVWGVAFVVAATVAAIAGDAGDPRRTLLVVLVGVWGLRLAGYLAWRNIGKGEDPRYAAMRAKRPTTFATRSLVTVFLLQGVLAWIVSLPVQLALVRGDGDLGVLAVLGIALWCVGLFFEAVGDTQLARFKADPANKGIVMDRGLWRYTRHPNYFGDFCVWWGLFLVCAEVGQAWYGIVGPIVMTVLLTRVSGVPLLEKSMSSRRAGYDEYVRRTSSFFPRPPRP